MAAPTDSVAISAIPTSVVTAAGTDIFPVVQGGVTKQETLNQALTWIESAISLDTARITAGQLALARGGTGADLSATGGANQIVRQNSAGGVFTVSALAAADIPNLDAGKITTGTLAVARGGTGLGTYAVGDLIIADGAASLAKLAGVATGNALISGGIATAPIWGKIDLTTHVSGILPSANGGTGVNNAGTLTNASNTTITGGGTLALGGFTLTVPASGTAALLATANAFTAAQSVSLDDAATNTTSTLLTVDHSSSGTPAASFGSRVLFNLESTTTLARNAAALDVVWTTPTDASRASAVLVNTVAAAGALTESLRIINNGIAVGGAAGTGVSLDLAGSVWRLTSPSGKALTLGVDGNELIRLDTSANVGIGTTAATSKLHVRLNNATTAAADTVITYTHSSSGTPAAGFGLTVLRQLESSTTEFTSAADDTTSWVVATHAGRTARRVFSIYDTAAREAMRMEASGTAPMIGFLGAAAVVRQTLSAAATDPATTQTLANDLRTALINLGLAA